MRTGALLPSFFFSSRRRHTRYWRDWSSDVCSSDLSSPTNLIAPGQARLMGEGWETARRRDDGNDWVEFSLAGPGVVRLAELDTSYFVGNSPGWASLHGTRRGPGARAGSEDWTELLPRTRLQPDTRHLFRLPDVGEVDTVRLDVFPDGGMARVRLHGAVSDRGRAELGLRDRKSTRLNSSHANISYAVFCLKK